MAAAALWSYGCPALHERVSEILQRHSTNPADVREVALSGLDLAHLRHVLDLGCGYGFMAEAIARRTAPDARIVGVDAWASNQAPFLRKIAGTGRRGSFRCMEVDAALPWPDGRFDLAVCCYSLYFFVEVLPEVARVLAPGGLFVTVTHSEHRLAGQLPHAGFGDAAAGLLSVTRRFSAENGEERLRRFFGTVERIEYRNTLRFEARHVDDLQTYLRFKLPLLVPGAAPGDELPARLSRYLRETLERDGELVVEKNDAIFRCREPNAR